MTGQQEDHPSIVTLPCHVEIELLHPLHGWPISQRPRQASKKNKSANAMDSSNLCMWSAFCCFVLIIQTILKEAK